MHSSAVRRWTAHKLNNGDGTFAAAVDYDVNGHHTAVALGDLNNDGVLDLVTGNDSITIRLGNGDGSFQSPSATILGYTLLQVVLSDFNHDGLLDLAAATFSYSEIVVRLGNGDGTFQAATTYTIPDSQLTGLAVGDFNRDGQQDIAVAGQVNGSVIVLWGIGDGTFQTGVSYAGSSYLGSFSSFAVAVGDLRGTGSPDVLVANSDAVSILLNETPAPDVRVQAYHYDGVQRLRSATAPGMATLYDYDLAGNRTAVWSNGQLLEHRAYDAANQVLGWQYDAVGNLLDDGTATYAYDALNRLTERAATSYSYNGDGVLVDDGSTQYTQDLASPLTQILQATQGLTATNHMYGHERLTSEIGGTRTWYATDALSSVRQTVNDSGAVLGAVSYDPWGNVASGTTTGFGFTGEMQDPSGMVYLRARWYNPAQGRFGARDPFAGDIYQPQSLHIYAYAHNNSINLIDPTGKYACDESSLNPLRWIDLAGYHGFCKRTRTELLTSDSYFTEDQRVNQDSLGALIYLFDNPHFPGGSGTEASKRRREHLTVAQERLEFILWLTSNGNQAHFAIKFKDWGFDQQFRDSEIHPGSANQVGHFLTAVDLGYNPLVNDFFSISCIVGHEQSADNSINNSIAINSKQCLQTWPSDIRQFDQAIVADVNGDYQQRDCIMVALVGPNPEARLGNSVQDLRLSVKGWIFGRNIRDGVIQDLSQARKWLVHLGLNSHVV